MRERTIKAVRTRFWLITLCFFLVNSPLKAAAAELCFPPERPFVPHDQNAVREYRDIIRRDFERYVTDTQLYFRCLDEERARAFEEARKVSEDYGRFLQIAAE